MITQADSPWFPRGSSVGCPYPLNHTSGVVGIVCHTKRLHDVQERLMFVFFFFFENLVMGGPL